MLAAIIFAIGVITPMDQTVNVTQGHQARRRQLRRRRQREDVGPRRRFASRSRCSDRETVDVKPGDQVLTIRSRSVRGGRPRSLDYALTVPKWMAINVNGTYVDADADGVGAGRARSKRPTATSKSAAARASCR